MPRQRPRPFELTSQAKRRLRALTRFPGRSGLIEEPVGCAWCSNSCFSSCSGGCANTCSGSCEGGCRGSCSGDCSGSRR